MNYLAHAYLSFAEPEIVVGNMISDFVKGKKKFDFAPGIQKGIQLHRLIDTFTDSHPATGAAKAFFRPAYGLYAGAFVDIVYDHFLAKDRREFADLKSLESFAQQTYRQLALHEAIFPDKFKRLFYYMRLQDWLSHYRFPEMIRNSFSGLVRRATYMDDHRPAFLVFEQHYQALESCYSMFFPDVKRYAFAVWQT
jgi:acyl carrier protein phosphodiesterase